MMKKLMSMKVNSKKMKKKNSLNYKTQIKAII